MEGNWRKRDIMIPIGKGIDRRRLPAPLISYTRNILGFVSRTRDPNKNVPKESEYIFVNGIQHPLYCNPVLGKDLPDELFVEFANQKERTGVPKRNIPPRQIPWFTSNQTKFGIDLRRVKTQIIPYNMESVRKQQKEMSAVRHWINTHEEQFATLRPNFVSNRYILKQIMVVGFKRHEFSFSAELHNGTIYLREVRSAQNAARRKNCNYRRGRGCGSVFESVMMRAAENWRVKETNSYDLNETTYGIQVGHIQNISILFSGEIDGFWGDTSGSWDASKEKNLEILDERVVEVKKIHQDVFLPISSESFCTKMATSFAQCFLSGVDKILYGITNNKDVARLQVVGLDEILTEIESKGGDNNRCTDGCNPYTFRLHGTLDKIRSIVTEEHPTIYICSTTNESLNLVNVNKISPLDRTTSTPPSEE